jgi:hypothetical protein
VDRHCRVTEQVQAELMPAVNVRLEAEWDKMGFGPGKQLTDARCRGGKQQFKETPVKPVGISKTGIPWCSPAVGGVADIGNSATIRVQQKVFADAVKVKSRGPAAN